MYGLSDRISATDDSPDSGARVIALFPRATVLVVERDPTTSPLLHPLAAHCDVAVAGSVSEALAALHRVRPAVILVDAGIDSEAIVSLADGLIAAGLEAISLITIDPVEPLNADALMQRIRAAFHVGRRVWFGGGLRSRMAA